MTFNRERERLDNLIFLFNNQSLSMSKDSSNNVLSRKFSPDEVSRAIDINSAMRVNFSDKREFTFSDRENKMAVGNIFIKAKSFWQMSKRFLESISEYPRNLVPCSF